MTPTQAQARRQRAREYGSSRRNLIAYGRREPVTQIEAAAAVEHLDAHRGVHDLANDALSGHATAAALYPSHHQARPWSTPSTHAVITATRFDLPLLHPLRTINARGARPDFKPWPSKATPSAATPATHVQVLSRRDYAQRAYVRLAKDNLAVYVATYCEHGTSTSTRARRYPESQSWFSRAMREADTIGLPEELVKDPDFVDDVAITRAVDVHQCVTLRPIEREAVIARGLDRRLPAHQVTQMAGVSDRTVGPHRCHRGANSHVARATRGEALHEHCCRLPRPVHRG